MKNLKEAAKPALLNIGTTVLYYIGIGLAGGSLYLGLLFGCQGISEKRSPKINSESQLESIITEESKRLGLGKNISVKVLLNSNNKGHSYSEKIAELGGTEAYPDIKAYEIGLRKGAHVADIRHEFYHIADGCFESDTRSRFRLVNDMKYLFWYEPRATIYELIGWKYK